MMAEHCTTAQDNTNNVSHVVSIQKKNIAYLISTCAGEKAEIIHLKLFHTQRTLRLVIHVVSHLGVFPSIQSFWWHTNSGQR